MHKILLDSVRENNKEPRKIRNVQNWIGSKGCTIEEAIFVSPVPDEVPILLDNLFNYMNDLYIDPLWDKIKLLLQIESSFILQFR